ncbi:hypothetical protein [Amycolatopsis nigrescens]|uniref:hypothetical protein n=1 Tax=Amycolatopsis nigrescens TaxID=381445 RepID=UPI00047699D4|nr:hypothetical protein [Amycolatopsis nigrescens]
MTRPATMSVRSSSDGATVVKAVTVIMGAVVGLTFLFGFGNVLSLALRLGVLVWVAPLVAPAVDLSILGLLLGTRHLALAGASADVLRPARRLLTFASMVTLTLNVADPVVAGQYGKAAFDAVGPLLLIGWAEVGPGFLQAIGECNSSTATRTAVTEGQPELLVREQPGMSPVGRETNWEEAGGQDGPRLTRPKRSPEKLLELAREADATHRAAHQKPISADALRVQLGIGATQAQRLVKAVRSEFQARVEGDQRSSNVPRDAERGGEPVAA